MKKFGLRRKIFKSAVWATITYLYYSVLTLIFVLQRKLGAEFIVIQGCILHTAFFHKQRYRLNTLYLH